ncbi:hypothetical protein Tco_0474589 [Tanacetum coccineum]
MATLKFADTHNMVAFLTKPAESEGFQQIVDFLNANPIRYALTINPTIYTLCIKQLWATVKVKTVNGEMGYEKISQKLTFYKAFFSPQWKFLIHTILYCLSSKTTAWNEFNSTMASAIICLATNQKFNFSKYIFESIVKNLDNAGNFLMYPRFIQVFLDKQLEGMPTHNRIYIAPSHTKKIFRNIRRVGKGFSGRETPLFQTMMVQHQEEIGEGLANPTDPHHTPTIIQPSTSQPQKKQISRRSKRKDTEVPQPSGPTTNVADEAVNEEMDDSLVRAATTALSLEAEHDSGNINKTQSRATPNEPSSPGTSSGGNTLRSGEDSLKLQELMELCTNLQQRVLGLETIKTTQATEIASLKSRVRVGSSRRVESSEDEGLGELDVTPPNYDAQRNTTLGATSQYMHTTLAELKSTKPKAVKAKTEADYQLAQRLQAQEQEELTDEEKARLTELVEENSKKAEAEIAQESSSKRAGDELEQENVKKQKVDEDKETLELQSLMEVVPDEEEVSIDVVPLATKPPTIVDWKIHKKGKKSYYQIIRADGKSKMYRVFSQMLKSFSREDLEDLYKLVKAKYGLTRLVEGLDLILWGDLKTMFEPHVEDQVWKNQDNYSVLDWKLYVSCGVHSLRKHNVYIHILVEKRYPLTPAIITNMLNKKL